MSVLCNVLIFQVFCKSEIISKFYQHPQLFLYTVEYSYKNYLMHEQNLREIIEISRQKKNQDWVTTHGLKNII